MNNQEHIQVFGIEWFKKHQRGLLWLLNSPFMRKWFKWMLRIRKEDAGYDGSARIIELAPHFYTILKGSTSEGKTIFKTEFRCHGKFSKRLYYAFKPLWHLLHAWDSIFADAFIPALSFGFNTLLMYPETGSGVNTCDGIITHNPGKTYLDTRDDPAGDNAAVSNAEDNQGGGGGGTDIYLHRTIYNFLTSSLGTGAQILAANCQIFIRQQTNGSRDVNLIGCTPASTNNLVVGDYSCYSALLNPTKFGAVDQNLPVAAINRYIWHEFNQSGKDYINRTGVTSLMNRDTNDMTATAGSYADSFWNMSDQVGNSRDPKLTVEWLPVNMISKPKTKMRPRPFAPGRSK